MRQRKSGEGRSKCLDNIGADAIVIKIYHFDLYRLGSPAELGTLGFDEYTGEGSICLIEWPDLAEKYLGKQLKKVKFSYGKRENERIIEINH